VTALAYVFWHQPADGVPATEYESLLRAFHQALAGAPSPGLLESASWRLSNVPWAPTGGPTYEDWYLLRDGSALDPLNDAAVSGPRHQPHDVVAARAGWGAAGLYRLREGRPQLPTVRQAFWFSKPGGRPYAAFYADLRGAAGPGSFALWGRQMVLGPTPEFCLHTAGEAPSSLGAPLIALRMDPIWSTIPGDDASE
jgi:hypothetical protein